MRASDIKNGLPISNSEPSGRVGIEPPRLEGAKEDKLTRMEDGRWKNSADFSHTEETKDATSTSNTERPTPKNEIGAEGLAAKELKELKKSGTLNRERN